MDSTEAYNYLLADSLMGRLILPPHKPFVFDTMIQFGGYNHHWMIVLAVFGSTVGILANYLLGKVLLTCERKEWIPMHRSTAFSKAVDIFRRYGVLLLFFTWIPLLGSAAAVASGFTKIQWWKVALVTLAGETVFFLLSAKGV